MMIKRKFTKQIKIGNVKVGGNAPISIQSMAKTPTSDTRSTIAQIKELEKCGCEIMRVAVRDLNDARAIAVIKRNIKIPLVCDIHFDYRLALEAIRSGADKIRLNPGNTRNKEEVKQVIRAAKKARIPIRIGVNSGSIAKGDGDLADNALRYIKIFEAMDFHDIIISLKASDVVSTVEAYRKMSALCRYPLHLGVTAAGPYDSGIVKSSVGIGALLLDGIGDTIRVSLTADPVEEVIAAKRILSAVGARRFGVDIVSCPTCGRCQVDLVKLVKELEDRVKGQRARDKKTKNLTVAVMGCEVNGPGEAREADIGIASGKGSGMLFKKGKVIKRIREKDFVATILKELKKI